MYFSRTLSTPGHFDCIPMIDGEFGCFEMNNNFEVELREAEPALFYHNTFNEEA